MLGSGSGLPDQLAFGVSIAIASLYLIWRGNQRSVPPVTLEITEAGVRLRDRLIQWQEIDEVRVTSGERGQAGQFLGSLLPDLALGMRDGSVVSIPREVLGAEPLGPWDTVIDAIRLAAPSIPIVDQTDGSLWG